ncbi:MAG: CHASE2 domain-containing protein [Treponema sp.]|nr:CHASE2 domain-containing protein [Treponema sp.]
MKKKVSFKTNIGVIIVGVSVIFWTLLFVVGLLQKFDFRVYNLLLGLKKNPETRKEILLVEADNQSLEMIGTWPWQRNVLGDALIRMKELGADTAVFDIEYLSPSNLAVNPDAEADIGHAFELEKQEVSKSVLQLSDAITSGMYRVSELPDLSQQIVEYSINPSFDNLLNTIQKSIYIDNDDYFSRAVQFFGKTWLTINTSDLDIAYKQEDVDYTVTRFLYDVDESSPNLVRDGNRRSLVEVMDNSVFKRIAEKNIDWEDKDVQKKYMIGFSPALSVFMTHASGAGFTNVVIDNDGTRRRVELLSNCYGRNVAQLSFAPLLGLLKPEKIVRTRNRIKLLGAHIPGNEKTENISIPLDDCGRMYVNWKHESFADSFRHESVMFLSQLDLMEKNIASLLGTLSGFVLGDAEGNPLEYNRIVANLVSSYQDILAYKNFLFSKCEGYDINGIPDGGGISDGEYAEYFALREDYFKNVHEFANGNELDAITARLSEMRDMLGEEQFAELSGDVANIFDTLKSEVNLYSQMFAEKKEIYKNSFCIIGDTASSTTDLGTTPFERAYPNVGTHANVYNTILTQDFITPLPSALGIVIAAVIALVTLFYTAKRKVSVQNVLGVAMIVVIILIPIFLMVFFGAYLPFIAPIMIIVTSYLGITVYRFINTDKDRKFITNAFGQCLSKEVVNEIVAHPESFKLGGQKLDMSAIFTDIQKFSAFSELLTASQLVALLNYYLTKMSDIIMDERGTVDKYEGDAIIALVGAPVNMKDHASRAIRAALKMKAAEVVMNEEILKIAAEPKPEGMDDDLYDAFTIMVNNKKTIFTRIGINSGEMIAGYMGSENKKNYTMMGNNVNLASRLEGVNKQYSTGGILISEYTKNFLNDDFILRRLDRVQVVNVNTPLRLYEPLAEKDGASEELVARVKVWENAMDSFEAGDYNAALSGFMTCLSKKQDDKVAKYYIKLISDFFMKGTYPKEEDGVGVAYNPELKAFRLLQK